MQDGPLDAGTTLSPDVPGSIARYKTGAVGPEYGPSPRLSLPVA